MSNASLGSESSTPLRRTITKLLALFVGTWSLPSAGCGPALRGGAPDAPRATTDAPLSAGPTASPSVTAPEAAPENGASLEFGSKIQKVSDTEFNVARTLIDALLRDPKELERAARAVPDKQGDKVVGFRLYGIHEGTLLFHFGLKNGDRVDSINGIELDAPQKFVEVFGQLGTANALHVKMDRSGTPLTIQCTIQ